VTVVIIFAERIQLIRSRAWLVRCVAYIRKYEECDSAWHTPCEVASEECDALRRSRSLSLPSSVLGVPGTSRLKRSGSTSYRLGCRFAAGAAGCIIGGMYVWYLFLAECGSRAVLNTVQ
jgi:hypothetical protein